MKNSPGVNNNNNNILDFTRYLGKLGNMMVTVVPVEIGAIGMIHKGLESGLEELEMRGEIETI